MVGGDHSFFTSDFSPFVASGSITVKIASQRQKIVSENF